MPLIINGSPAELPDDPRVSLLDVLRENLHLTGAKKGCNQGACGACTVLVDGERVLSCLTLAVQVDGRAVTTIEGLATSDSDLHPLQRAFVEHDGFQCGYCTPGQICSAVGMIEELKRGVPSHVTHDLSARRRIALEPRRAARAHERQPVPLRRLQRHRRRDRRDVAGARRMTPFSLQPAPASVAEAVRLGAQPQAKLPRRRHQPRRPDARDDRAADAAGRRHRPVEAPIEDTRRRRPAHRRGRAQHRAGLASAHVRARYPVLSRAIVAGASGADPQHGDGRRQPPAAHPLHLFLRRRRRALQQARARPGLRRHRRHSTASTPSSAPRRRASRRTRPTCAWRWPRSTPSCICKAPAASARCRSPTCTACRRTGPTSRRCSRPAS